MRTKILRDGADGPEVVDLPEWAEQLIGALPIGSAYHTVNVTLTRIGGLGEWRVSNLVMTAGAK